MGLPLLTLLAAAPTTTMKLIAAVAVAIAAFAAVTEGELRCEAIARSNSRPRILNCIFFPFLSPLVVL